MFLLSKTKKETKIPREFLWLDFVLMKRRTLRCNETVNQFVANHFAVLYSIKYITMHIFSSLISIPWLSCKYWRCTTQSRIDHLERHSKTGSIQGIYPHYLHTLWDLLFFIKELSIWIPFFALIEMSSKLSTLKWFSKMETLPNLIKLLNIWCFLLFLHHVRSKDILCDGF